MTGSNHKRDPHGGADPYSRLSHAREQRKRTYPLVIAGTVIVVVIFALVAFLATRSEDKGESPDGSGAAAAEAATQETAAVTVTGEPLAEMPAPAVGSSFTDPATDPAIGATAPALKGQTFDGGDVAIGPGDGTPKVIVFVAHWCPHCQAEVPRIQEWIDEGNLPKGVEIVAVSTAVDAERPNYPPSKWIASEGWTPQVLLDDAESSAAQAYGLSGFPYFVMVDGEGRVVARGSGEIPMGVFGEAVDALAAGKDPTAVG